MTESDTPTSTINAHVEQVAALLPFPVELDADMGGTFALQIDLGQRGGVDDPHDTAGIDPDNPRWWIDIEGGEKTLISDYGLDEDPASVASWIARVAREECCPAAVSGSEQRVRSIVSASFPAVAGELSSAKPTLTDAPAPTTRKGHER
ncbi:hypothetical protein HDC37_001324 [Microbacterium sp. AK009]|uniref:hypothetical protein n=1 Tax=Microbacterium sp. AK009 TaxID=2723068 RepID=UPI0015CE1D93|nr:hypothetical protein [Microbacterium sp. AK009]NYF16499.1 hypothetical protein [Microbacterium sp. AK009]